MVIRYYYKLLRWRRGARAPKLHVYTLGICGAIMSNDCSRMGRGPTFLITSQAEIVWWQPPGPDARRAKGGCFPGGRRAETVPIAVVWWAGGTRVESQPLTIRR
jgi:hypothetical protein